MDTVIFNTGYQKRVHVYSKDRFKALAGVSAQKAYGRKWQCSNLPFVKTRVVLKGKRVIFSYLVDTFNLPDVDFDRVYRVIPEFYGNSRDSFEYNSSRTPLAEFTVLSSAHLHPPRDVILSIDIGNSRTCGTIIEIDDENREADPENVHPLLFSPVLHTTANEEEVWSSLLHTCCTEKYSPSYTYEPTKMYTSFLGSMFGIGEYRIIRKTKQSSSFSRKESPFVIGNDAEFVRQSVNYYSGATCSVSSPKKYLNHCHEVRYPWSYVEVKGDGRTAKSISWDLFKCVPRNDDDKLYSVNDEDGFISYEPIRKNSDCDSFPRRFLFSMYVYQLLTCAYEYINSDKFRSVSDYLISRRRIRSVAFTYPSVVSGHERGRFKSQVDKGIHLYNTHASAMNTPTIDKSYTNWDEGVMAQLPYAQSVITDLCSDNVRVVTFDIGGGTTDIAVVQYEYGDMHGAYTAKIKTLDGVRYGGDELLRRIIADEIIPGLRDAVNKTHRENVNTDFTSESLDEFIAEFFGTKGGLGVRAKEIRSEMLDLFMIPLAHELIQFVGMGIPNDTILSSENINFTLNRFLECLIGEGGYISATTTDAIRDELKKNLGDCDIEKVILDTFSVQLAALHSVVNDCNKDHDIVVVMAGKLCGIDGVADIIKNKFKQVIGADIKYEIIAANKADCKLMENYTRGRLDSKITVCLGATLAHMGEGGYSVGGGLYSIVSDLNEDNYSWVWFDKSSNVTNVFGDDKDKTVKLMAKSHYYIGKRSDLCSKCIIPVYKVSIADNNTELTIDRIAATKESPEALEFNGLNILVSFGRPDDKSSWLETGVVL